VDLNDFLRGIADFGNWSPTDQIKLFAWYVHTHDGKDRFTAAEIRECYDRSGMAAPSISALIHNLVSSRKPLILKDGRGFRLERSLREQFDSRYGQRAITVEVHKTLRELPAKLPDLAERVYLEEALTCFTARAFRAAIVMCWNVAYDHLCTHVLADAARLGDFNRELKPKRPVTNRVDLYDHGESRVLEACRAAGLLDKNVFNVLEPGLKIRNRAAHASGSKFDQPQAEAYILDLINNAVLKL